MSNKKHTPSSVVGRADELRRICACLTAGRNVLLEGPVGVGKTYLASAAADTLGVPIFRIDGDSRYSEQKLAGWFDPPLVIKAGFSKKTFIPGPLVKAMQEGGALFINELNRLPEGVQNILLPAIDERMVVIPRLGEVRAKEGFLVIATQNPKEFVATSHLSEAILDRFELVVLDYQPEGDELHIVEDKLREAEISKSTQARLALAAVRITRTTRNHPRVRRGASIRAAISTAEIAAVLIHEGADFKGAFLQAVLMALPTRIEIEREAESDRTAREDIESLLETWAKDVLETLDQDASEKKKS